MHRHSVAAFQRMYQKMPANRIGVFCQQESFTLYIEMPVFSECASHSAGFKSVLKGSSPPCS